MQEAEGRFKGNYAGSISQLWQQFFTSLAPHSHVLDLATGNGAVLHFALDTARQQQLPLNLTGVDLAAIQPWAHVDITDIAPANLNFMPQVNITDLPFEAAQFDAVVSQYGAEYAPLPAVITECARVLKPSGQLQWICHSTDSAVYATSCTEIEDADFLLSTADPARHIDALLQLQADTIAASNDQFVIPAGSHQATANSDERRRMDESLQQCMMRLQQHHNSEILQHSLQNLAYIYQHRSQFPLKDVLNKLAEWQLEVSLYRERLQALVNAAVDEQTVETIKTLCQDNGFESIRMAPVRRADNVIIGTLIQAQI